MYILLFWVCTDFCVYDFGARPDRRPGGGGVWVQQKKLVY